MQDASLRQVENKNWRDGRGKCSEKYMGESIQRNNGGDETNEKLENLYEEPKITTAARHKDSNGWDIYRVWKK